MWFTRQAKLFSFPRALNPKYYNSVVGWKCFFFFSSLMCFLYTLFSFMRFRSCEFVTFSYCWQNKLQKLWFSSRLIFMTELYEIFELKYTNTNVRIHLQYSNTYSMEIIFYSLYFKYFYSCCNRFSFFFSVSNRSAPHHATFNVNLIRNCTAYIH